VTGASRGIGEAIASELATMGAVVIGTATTQEGAEKISAKFAAQGITGRGMQLDVTKISTLGEFLSNIAREFSEPAILINNAAVTRDNIILRMKDEEWQSVIDTNLNAVYYLTRECVKPMLKARWGRIVTIGSVVGATGNIGQSNYTAAKAGVIGFTKTIAQELASRNITANVVAPGFIETDMTSSLNDQHRDQIINQIPLKRVGKPADIAAAVGFLVSERASYITGETINVNGGMYMA